MLSGRSLIVISAALCTVSLVFVYTTWHLMDQRPAFSEKAVDQVISSGFFGDDVRPYVFGSTFLAPEGASVIRLHLGLFAVATALVYTTAFFSQVLVVRKLRQLRPSMLSATRKMHDDLNRALIAYALCPMVASGLPLTFCIVDVFIADAAEHFLIFACTVISSIAIWNPVTTCVLIRPYRAALIRCFRGKNPEPKAVTTVTSTVFSNT